MNINLNNLTHEPTHSEENHATLSLNQWNRVVIRMDTGWCFWQTTDYVEYDDEGNALGYYDPPAEQIAYSRYGVFSPQTDFTTIIAVDESTVNADQITGVADKPVAE